MARQLIDPYDPSECVLTAPFYCLNNQFYHQLCMSCQTEVRLPILDNPKPEAGYTHVKTHSSMSQWIGVNPQYPMYRELQVASREYLKGCGVEITNADLKKSGFALAALYLLETGVVVFQTSDGKSGLKATLCTKNRDLLRSELKLSQARFAELDRHCAESAEEVIAGKLKCVTLEVDSDGLSSPRCGVLNVDRRGSLIVPWIALSQYISLICGILAQKILRISFIDADGVKQSTAATLNPLILQERFQSDLGMLDGVGFVQLQTSVILLRLADLDKRRCVDVPVTRIVSAKPV